MFYIYAFVFKNRTISSFIKLMIKNRYGVEDEHQMNAKLLDKSVEKFSLKA